jgi:hypothetical protein
MKLHTRRSRGHWDSRGHLERTYAALLRVQLAEHQVDPDPLGFLGHGNRKAAFFFAQTGEQLVEMKRRSRALESTMRLRSNDSSTARAARRLDWRACLSQLAKIEQQQLGRFLRRERHRTLGRDSGAVPCAENDVAERHFALHEV